MGNDGFTALTWACIKGHREVVLELLAGRANANALTPSTGKTPLSLCAECGYVDIVVELLSCRVELEQPNSSGSTPLMSAAHRGEAEVVALLLKRSAQINLSDADGWTALMYALHACASSDHYVEKTVRLEGSHGRKTCAELLILHSADTNAQTHDGITPLIVAAESCRVAPVMQLVQHRAQVNLATARNVTPLLIACASKGSNSEEMVRLLIAVSADVNYATSKGDTPVSVAERRGHREVVQLLKTAGATTLKARRRAKPKGRNRP